MSIPFASNSLAAPRGGVFAALWLPTDQDGNLLRQELARNLAFLKQHHVTGVLALGSTGEFPQFNLEERKRALATVVELAAPLQVIVNVSDIRPRAVAELGRFARELGLTAIAVMPPGFFPSRQDDALAHFRHAAESSQLPTFLYNFPELTGTRINLSTVAAFADTGCMGGIKQSGGDFGYHKELIALGKEKGFVVFSGSDTRLPEVFGLGADGCIGGLVNIAPDLMVQIYRVCREGAPGAVAPAVDQLKQIGAIIDRLTFPLNVAAGMEARGLHPGVPKAIVSPSSMEIYRKIVHDLREQMLAWKLDLAGDGSTAS